jgi:predicted acetyltransferase
MKLVKQSLYEKFTEKSDPIEDLGIGSIHVKLWKKKFYEIGASNILNTYEKYIYPVINKTYNNVTQEAFIMYIYYVLSEIIHVQKKSFVKNRVDRATKNFLLMYRYKEQYMDLSLKEIIKINKKILKTEFYIFI